jgi:hypothetical protein
MMLKGGHNDVKIKKKKIFTHVVFELYMWTFFFSHQ